MNNLIIRNHITYFDSRQVAKMIDKRHDHLIRDIEKYIKVLTNPKLGTLKHKNSINPKLDALNFFVKSSYKDSKGEKRTCYLISKIGCEFIANKMTGDKGILFTAIYVKQFNEMEQIQMQKTTKEWQELRDLSKINMADKCIHEGIAQQRPYKEIYTTCRDRLKTMQIWGALAVAS